MCYVVLDWLPHHCAHDKFELEESFSIYRCKGCGTWLQDECLKEDE